MLGSGPLDRAFGSPDKLAHFSLIDSSPMEPRLNQWDFVIKASSSAPAISHIVDQFSNFGISNVSQPGESSGMPTQATTPTQPKDLNISGQPKVPLTSASVSTKSTDLVSEVLQGHESVNGNHVNVVKTDTSGDLNMNTPDLPTFEHVPGYALTDDLLAAICPSDEYTDHNKESGDVGGKGKSVITTCLYMPPEMISEHNNESFNSSHAPTNTYGLPGMVAGDNNKQLPTDAAPSRTPDGFGFQGVKQHAKMSSLDLPDGFSFQGVKQHTKIVALDLPIHPLGRPYERDDGYNDNVVGTFHRGIRCDGCGMHPIIGPRFKSNVKEDYDLCSRCFSEMGNKADYTRFDRAHHSSRRAFKDCNSHSRRWLHSPHLHGFGARQSRSKLESHFIQDVTVYDGTVLPPSTPFTKIWRMRNTGSTWWPYGTRLVWVDGDRFANRDSVLLEIPADGFPVNEKVDIAVDLTSPAKPGRYISYWRLASPSGQKFGQQVWVLIQVDISRPSSAIGGFSADLNLNLPPESTSRDGFGIIDVNAEPFDDVAPEPILTNVSDELVKPFVNEVPTDGVHPAAADAIARPTPIVNHPVSYPIIDLSVSEYESSFLVPPSKTVAEDNTVEETLLDELESMGFKQIDLNKEILRLNKYDLEQSIDDLCSYSEWEPLLEELQEMGFSDRVMNKKLLIKYGGSIKRVVLDLIAGEKA
ncbi:Zinc finger, ZZ type [Musa troglodytarum]|uniref:Zinc finger, ZZ type n=1 Tax=Musa troglodytarum TaxID=320322 RepID=A0A9E7HBZ2_9LILI|nr:Zinc finger, ZZ type [Musa troglodytarum]